MQDQGKRLILAVALALGILLLWNILFPSKDSPKKPDVTEEQTPIQRQSPVGIPDGAEMPPVAAESAEPAPLVIETPHVVVAFSARGGRLASWQLTDEKYERDFSRGELVDEAYGALTVNFYKSPIVIPQNAIWAQTYDPANPNHVEYRYEDADLIVVKQFDLELDAYRVRMKVAVELKKDKDGKDRTVTEQLAISMVGEQNSKAPAGGGMGRTSRERRAACHLNGGVSQVSARQLHERGALERGGSVRWAGFNHAYLFFAVAPYLGDGNARQNPESLSCNMYPVLDVDGGMQVDLVYPPQPLASNAPAYERTVVAFIGPKHLSDLEGADEAYDTNFAGSVDLGWFGIIGRPLLSLLRWFHGFVGNWAIAIVLLTLLVKLATLYWTTKSMRSMRRMSALAPQMKVLQEKYGDDRAKLQQETMAMYKANGVNPLSGCLPILLQMPIWLALYRMLSAAGELYLAPAIPGWIDDLTATDPYHILPIILVGMMFLQSKTSPATLDSMQQKILVYGMPLMFGVMSFFFPSGLTIYILTNTTLGLLHTLYMRKFDKSAKMVPAPVVPPPSDDKDKLKPRAAAGARKPKAAAAKPAPEPEVIEAEGDEVAEDDADDTEAAPEPVKNGQVTSPNRRANAQRRRRKRKH